MQEIWKDIKEFEGLYQVSNLGQVRSLRYKNKKEINILNQFELNNKAKRKYLAVSLSKDNINYKKTVHRLVAEAFIKNTENKSQVNHIDGNKKNNRVDNLEWCTPKYNVQEAWRLGLITKEGTNSFGHNLPDNRRRIEQYSMDGKLIKTWSSITSASKKLGVSASMICQCCKGKFKQTGGYIWKYVDNK